MGKVLLSKLLRACPDIETIYVLIRSSQGKPADARLKEMLALPVSVLSESLTQDLFLTHVHRC